MKEAMGGVNRALLSVYDKEGLVDLAKGLRRAGVEIIASGGTAKALATGDIEHRAVEAFTGAKEVLGGRVKTLHPRIHAGILADRGSQEHMGDLQANDYVPIDMVVCNLYPFQRVLAQGGEPAELIENIDIGGPTLVRAAAKNAKGGVTVVTDPADYPAVLEQIAGHGGSIDDATRKRLAAKAFRMVADYDLAIAGWYESYATAKPATGGAERGCEMPPRIGEFCRGPQLRYGENPHQKACLYVADAETRGVGRGTLLAGKELSYNNYLDMDGAYRAVWQVHKPGCAIIKHTNACGLAQAPSQAEAFERALAGDPVSAFGSVIGFNTPLDATTAEAIRASKLFVECIVAPGFDADALELFKKRTNLRLFEVPPDDPAPAYHAHRIGGGLLVEEVDGGLADPSAWQVVSEQKLQEGWLAELAFAMRAAAVLKSNAIAITKGRALLGAGAGQMSRVDATEQALKKAGEAAKGSFMGSDAFFPFSDCVRLAAEAGVVAIAQPGGSKRDQESIDACNELGLAMVFTGRRHFRH